MSRHHQRTCCNDGWYGTCQNHGGAGCRGGPPLEKCHCQGCDSWPDCPRQACGCGPKRYPSPGKINQRDCGCRRSPRKPVDCGCHRQPPRDCQPGGPGEPQNPDPLPELRSLTYGPYEVEVLRIKACASFDLCCQALQPGAYANPPPYNIKIYVPQGGGEAGDLPVVIFCPGFSLGDGAYDQIMTQLASQGVIPVVLDTGLLESADSKKKGIQETIQWLASRQPVLKSSLNPLTCFRRRSEDLDTVPAISRLTEGRASLDRWIIGGHSQGAFAAAMLANDLIPGNSVVPGTDLQLAGLMLWSPVSDAGYFASLPEEQLRSPLPLLTFGTGKDSSLIPCEPCADPNNVLNCRSTYAFFQASVNAVPKTQIIGNEDGHNDYCDPLVFQNLACQRGTWAAVADFKDLVSLSSASFIQHISGYGIRLSSQCFLDCSYLSAETRLPPNFISCTIVDS